MSPARLAVSCALAALVLTGCGSSPTAVGHGQIDDPRTAKQDPFQCIKDHGLPASLVGSTEIQVGSPPAGPMIKFTPTPGSAQADQIEARAPGSEVIGSALLYPNQASDSDLTKIEKCLAQGVKG
jgi:hypothetical protein